MREWNDKLPDELPHSYTAADLQWMEFPPLKFAIPGYLVEGLTILVGKPKRGKSWMALDWLLAIAHGGMAFGSIKCDVGDCLYMALEDGKRRMQRRIKQLLPHSKEWTPRLTIRHKMERLDKGGLDEIREWATGVPLPSLVVIDTFVKVRPRRQDKTEQQYDADYHAMSLLQELATELSIAIVVVHHQRKMESEDPLDTASGSTGLTGAADSILVVSRDGQGTTLYGRRDLDDIDVALSFDSETGRWAILGAANEVRRSESRTAILSVLEKADEQLTPAAIAIMTGIARNVIDAQLHRMMKTGEVISRRRGRYGHPDKS